MSLDALIMLSGALVAFLSLAGFPPSWYKPMFFVLGIFVIVLGIVVRRRGFYSESPKSHHNEPMREDISPSHSGHEQVNG